MGGLEVRRGGISRGVNPFPLPPPLIFNSPETGGTIWTFSGYYFLLGFFHNAMQFTSCSENIAMETYAGMRSRSLEVRRKMDKSRVLQAFGPIYAPRP